MKKHIHKWEEIGQTYTFNIQTLIEWCSICGALKYSRLAWDYKEWIKNVKKTKQ